MSAAMQELTELENPNSVQQMKQWLSENGMETDSLDKKAMAGLLQDAPEPLRTVLTLRQQLAKSSVKKYQAMENAVCQDSRAAGDPAVRHACNDAPVKQVSNAAIVARFPVFQKQIREIRTLPVISMVCMKLPLQPVFKDFMRFSAPIARFPRNTASFPYSCIYVR